MPRPGGRNFEKSKDFKGSIKRLLSNLSNFKILLIIALTLAMVSSILSLIAPNKLSDLTDTVTAGIKPNISEKRIKNIMTDPNISMSDKMKFTEVMGSIKKNEPQSDFFWQTIDLQRLPGTTVLRGSAVKPNINASGDFTGGCGIGENGVCAMELISDENSLTANKAWFFFDKEVVCLGNGINSTDENETETIIENRLVTDNSRFTVHGSEESEGYLIKGAYLDGSHDVGYYFPEEQEVNILREIRTGDWNNMSIKTDGKSYKGMYLTMWIKHGKKAKDGSYEYIVIPKCNEEEIKDYYRKSGIRVIENSDSIQCVKKNGITGIVFLKDKTHSAGGVSCDKRCVVMTAQNGEELELSVADITHNHDRLYIELDYSAQSVMTKSERINVGRKPALPDSALYN